MKFSMKLAFTGASVLLLCLVWLLSRGGQTLPLAAADGPGPALPIPDPAPAKLPRLHLAQGDRPDNNQRRRVAAEAAETTAAPATATRDDTQGLLTGRIVVKGDDGREAADLSGLIEVCLLHGDKVRYEDVTVESGAFELRMDADEIATFQHGGWKSGLVLGRHAARLEHPEKQYSSEQSPVLLRASWPSPLRLHVLSADSGQPIDRVLLIPIDRWGDDHGAHPGSYRRQDLVSDGSPSPLTLFPTTGELNGNASTYYVGSEGYAWQVVSLDLSQGGDREVRLEAGGNVEIGLVGDRPRAPMQICFFLGQQGDGRPNLQLTAPKEGPLEVTNLTPGTYVVRAQAGDWFHDPIVFGEARVDVIAGRHTSHQLLLKAPEKGTRSPLAGTLVIPYEWGSDQFSLSARLEGTAPDGSQPRRHRDKGQMSKSATEPGAWTFDLGSIVTGRYRLEVRMGTRPTQVTYGQVYTHEIGGSNAVRIEIPQPASVTLTIQDATHGGPAALRSVHWAAIVRPSTHSTSLNSVEASGDPGVFRFRAPVGEISVGAFGGDYCTLREIATLHPGDNQLIYRLDRNCPLTIRLFDGETPVPFPDGYYPMPKHQGGEGELLFTSSGSQGFRTALSEPGSYTFELPPVPGFEAIPPQIIHVVRDDETTWRVPLQRKQ